MESTILHHLTPEELSSQFLEIKKQLAEIKENFQPIKPNEYIPKNTLAEMLDVHITTIDNWTKKGLLKPLGIGHRVYFLRSDIEKTITQINAGENN